MSTPYEKEFVVTTEDADQIVPLAFPGRCILDRIAVVRLGGGAVDLAVYNRSFTGPVAIIDAIESDESGSPKTKLVLYSPMAVKVGDVLAVAGTDAAGYNTDHRVVAIVMEQRSGDNRPHAPYVDAMCLITDQAYVADAKGGTARIAIPAAEQPLYLVTDLSDTDSAEDYPYMTYVNLDPLLNVNIGVNRKIYVKFAEAATYKLVLRAREGVAVGA